MRSAYVRGTHDGLYGKISLSVPGLDPVEWEGKIIEGGSLETQEISFELE